LGKDVPAAALHERSVVAASQSGQVSYQLPRMRTTKPMTWPILLFLVDLICQVVRTKIKEPTAPGAQTDCPGHGRAGEDIAWRRGLTGRLLPDSMNA
jgi:hypothetical protein